MPARRGKNYYAVLSGHELDKPIIYSSWAKADLRVTGVKGARHRGFASLQAARDFMSKEGYGKGAFKEDLKPEDESLPSTGTSEVYYAVAKGSTPGIYNSYGGSEGSQQQTDRYSRACHKRFNSIEQAETFIKERKDEIREIMVAARKRELHPGLPPATNATFLSDHGLNLANQDAVGALTEEIAALSL